MITSQAPPSNIASYIFDKAGAPVQILVKKTKTKKIAVINIFSSIKSRVFIKKRCTDLSHRIQHCPEYVRAAIEDTVMKTPQRAYASVMHKVNFPVRLCVCVYQ